MIKRIAIAIIVFLVVFLLASALVGADVISATFGLVLWLIGLAAAIGAFVKTKPRGNYRSMQGRGNCPLLFIEGLVRKSPAHYR